MPKSVEANSLDERSLRGSPAATAIAISALVVAEQHAESLDACQPGDEMMAFNPAYQGDLSELLIDSLKQLARSHNSDGGWGSRCGTPSSPSDTLSVWCAFQLAGVPACYGDIGSQIELYLESAGGLAQLTAAPDDPGAEDVARLTHLAIAGRVPWRRLRQFRVASPTRNERTTRNSPPSDRALRLAASLAIHHALPTRIPWRRRARQLAAPKIIAEIAALQSTDGSFGGSVKSTGYVVLFLAAAGFPHIPLVRFGVEYLLGASPATACGWSHRRRARPRGRPSSHRRVLLLRWVCQTQRPAPAKSVDADSRLFFSRAIGGPPPRNAIAREPLLC